MALFSRRGHRGHDPIEPEPATPAPLDEPATATTPDEAPDAPDAPGAEATPARGPWDSAEQEIGDRVDLGAIWLPKRYRVSLEAADDGHGGVPIAVAVEDGGLTMRVQAFAAPKSSGIWDEIREELAEQARTGDGVVSDVPGPFGRELLISLPAGGGKRNDVRFWGVDGPRWFVRAVLTGPHVLEDQAVERFADVFADVVVVRGTEARAPRELLELRPPEQAPDSSAADASFDPMRRGPEITEVR